MRVEAGIDRAQRDEGADEERSADEQHQRQPHLGHDEQGTYLVLTKPAARLPAALLDCRVEVDARRLHGRNQPEDQAGHERHGGGERQHSPIDADPGAVNADAWDVAGVDGEQRPDADDADRQPENAAHRRQQDALGQQLANDPAAAGADRRTNRDLAPAHGRAHEQQVRDVRAGDQQDEDDRAQQHPQRRSHVADDHLLHRLDAEAALAAERVRKRLAELGGGLLQLRVGGGERDAWLQAAGGEKEVPLHDTVRIDLKGQPDVGRAGLRLDGFRVERAQHADHFVRLAVQRQLAADDGGIGAKAPPPEPVTQHGNTPAVRQILGGSKGPPCRHRRSEQPEEVRADVSGRDLFRVAFSQVDHAEPECRHVLDDGRLPAPIVELGWRRSLSNSLRRGIDEHDEAARIRVGERPQQDGVHDREDRRVRADAERQRGNGGKGEGRAVPGGAKRVPQILKECLHDETSVSKKRSCADLLRPRDRGFGLEAVLRNRP
jgi:hypothetical protein